MKYIVIQGRLPQDGSEAKTALIMFPDWVSPTLVCAGVIGRVQELTDGGIIEQGNAPTSEQEVLAGLRPNGFNPLLVAPAPPQPTDLDALLVEFGAEIGDCYMSFLRGELEELAQFRKDRPETLAQLQLAHDTIENFNGWKPPVEHDPLRLEEFGTLEEAQAAHDALADKCDELHEQLIQRTNQRDALYTTALNNLNTLRDK
jgi:hypothetical protein